MVKSFSMQGVASYKEKVSIRDLGKVNLFYGLNGTGKSILARVLASGYNFKTIFPGCEIEFEQNTLEPEILVYSQDFIDKNFREKDKQPGFLHLVQIIKEAGEAIAKAENLLESLTKDQKALTYEKGKIEEARINSKKRPCKKVWTVKTDYYNTPFREAMNGSVSSHEAFFDKLLSYNSLEIDQENIHKALEDLRKEVKELNESKEIKNPP